MPSGVSSFMSPERRSSFSLPSCLLVSLILHSILISFWGQYWQLPSDAPGDSPQRGVWVTFAAHHDDPLKSGEEYLREASQLAYDEPGTVIEPALAGDRAVLSPASAAPPRVEARSSSTVSASTGSVPEAPTPEAIGEYRLNLARAAHGFRQYPPLARARGWEGVVVVVVTTVAGVGRPQVRLSQSSGVEALDDQALSMLEQAVFVAALPSGLRGRQFALTLPIHFSLDGDSD